MRRFMTVLGAALIGFAVLPAVVQAQVIYVQPARVYAPPIIVVPQATYYAAPSVTTFSAGATYSYYPSGTTVFAPSVGAPSTVVTYSVGAAPVYVAPVAGVITTRTSYGYGILRPRGYYTETYYTPLR
ncbi:MAG: hypothetical protein HY289_05605 [Planctomycetes bacterium]|nr:hypothetical protein [Planctomycetota bacterium]